MTETTLKQSPISTGSNVTEELVTLIRGFFSMPVISALGRQGVLDGIAKQDVFAAEDFKDVPNTLLLGYSFEYLARIGLLQYEDKEKPSFRATELGKQIFQRVNSFYAPHSYHPYMRQFREQLMNEGDYTKLDVDRLENIIGSGRTHERYFPSAVSFLKRKIKFDVMVDIGCGDGRFLEFVLKGVPGVKIVGIDISEISTKTTQKNLQEKFPGREINTVCSDAGDVAKWSQGLNEHLKGQSLAISMWFLLHEISNRKPENVIQFLKQVHELYPQASLVICELVRQDAELLAQYRKNIVMPEYLLFHDISLQGVLSWEEYQYVLDNIPYQLAMERTFDEIGEAGDVKQPATFVWCLNPK